MFGWSGRLALFSASGAIGTENESLCEERAMFYPQESIGKSSRVLTTLENLEISGNLLIRLQNSGNWELTPGIF